MRKSTCAPDSAEKERRQGGEEARELRRSEKPDRNVDGDETRRDQKVPANADAHREVARQRDLSGITCGPLTHDRGEKSNLSLSTCLFLEKFNLRILHMQRNSKDVDGNRTLVKIPNSILSKCEMSLVKSALIWESEK